LQDGVALRRLGTQCRSGNAEADPQKVPDHEQEDERYDDDDRDVDARRQAARGTGSHVQGCSRVRGQSLGCVIPDVSELQLLFAQYNNEWFSGEIPTHRIAYNARFSNLAGRITYKPPLIELSPKHFTHHPEALRETLLHEMIHAWLYALGQNSGHSAAFKKKMRELGLRSIYHDLGSAAPRRESEKRFILRCERCTMELLRKRKPAALISCGRCSRNRYDPRYPLRVLEVLEVRDLEAPRQAAHRLGTA